jgi:phage tail-like protein
MAKARTDTNEAIAPARFSLTIDGVEIAAFSTLVGIVSGVEPDDIAGALLKKLPGKRNPPTVTLRRGLTDDMQLSALHESAHDSRASSVKRSASLTMFNTAGEPVARYQLEHAWVPKIEIAPLKAGSNEVLMETVTLACDHLQRVAV